MMAIIMVVTILMITKTITLMIKVTKIIRRTKK